MRRPRRNQIMEPCSIVNLFLHGPQRLSAHREIPRQTFVNWSHPCSKPLDQTLCFKYFCAILASQPFKAFWDLIRSAWQRRGRVDVERLGPHAAISSALMFRFYTGR